MKIEYKDALYPEGDFENQTAQQNEVMSNVTALTENGLCFKGIGVDSNVRFLSIINLRLHFSTINGFHRASPKTCLILASLM